MCASFRNIIFFCSFIFLSQISFAKEKPMDRDQALKLVEQTKEAQALYQLEGGKFKDCVDKKVLKPCESHWVSCIEDAWVVQLEIGSKCGVKEDGRLSETMVVDTIRKKIISRFPEIDYFESPKYCKDHFDCIAFSTDDQGAYDCSNFIDGQLPEKKRLLKGICECQQNSCVKKP